MELKVPVSRDFTSTTSVVEAKEFIGRSALIAGLAF
jgi:hypothetical protein